MPFRSRGRSSRRRSASKGTIKEWFNWETIETGTWYHRPAILSPGAVQNAWLITPSDAHNQFDEPTIIRLLIRSWSIAAPPNAGAGDYDISFWQGLLVTRGEADTAGSMDGTPEITAERGDFDWLWWDSVHFHRWWTAIGTPVGYAMNNKPADFGPYGGVVDLRTKRRIPQGYGLLYCWATSPGPLDGIGAAVRTYTTGRCLLLNH